MFRNFEILARFAEKGIGAKMLGIFSVYGLVEKKHVV